MTRSRLFASAFVAAIVVAGLSRDEATVSAGRSRLGPTVMMFYGGTLTKPIVVSGPDVEAFGDVTRRSTITVAALGARPYLDVAMFWGPLRDPANNGTPLSGLTPQMAWQHGRFYPPSGTQPAVLLTTQLTKSTQPVPLPANGQAFTGGGEVPATALPLMRTLGLVPPGGGVTPR